jgi:Helix-turn-helix domain
MQSNEYLDTPLAAATLRLSQSTLNKWRLTGGGPKYLKIGRRVLYSRDTLEAWARAHERASTSDPGGLRKAA